MAANFCPECGNPLPENAEYNRIYCSRLCSMAARRRRANIRKAGIQSAEYIGYLGSLVQDKRYRWLVADSLQKITDELMAALRKID